MSTALPGRSSISWTADNRTQADRKPTPAGQFSFSLSIAWGCTVPNQSYNRVAQFPHVLAIHNGPLARYVKLRVAHTPGILGTFPQSKRVSDPDMHHSTCMTHLPWRMLGSLTSGFIWSRRHGVRSQHFRCMRNPRCYVSAKRPIMK